MSKEIEHLRYPVGRFKYEGPLDEATRQQYIETISRFPAQLREKVAGMNNAQIETPYRPEGWTARQVVHHVADSHMNSFIRFKLGMTEETPTIKPYEEAEWAKLADVREIPVSVSIDLLDALHLRWVALLKSFQAEDWQKNGFPSGNETRDYLRLFAGIICLALPTSPGAYRFGELDHHLVQCNKNFQTILINVKCRM